MVRIKMSTPNIFDYATSELSQDAFFAWLLSWAKDGFEKEDENLHDCALKMLKEFFKQYYEDFSKYYSKKFNNRYLKPIYDFKFITKIMDIDVSRQEKKIDLCVTIATDKGTYYLVIEDKTKSSQHNNQLEAYRNYIINEKKMERTCFIYLKTGELCDGEEEVVRAERYSLFDLKQIYDLLKSCKTGSEIFENYFSRLENIYFLRDFKNNNKVFCNSVFGNKNYKQGIWKDICYYVYNTQKLLSYKNEIYYFAVDIWAERKDLTFVLHIIRDIQGHWVENQKIFNSIKEIETVVNNNCSYELKGLYYEKKVSFNDKNDLNERIKTEIQNLFG